MAMWVCPLGFYTWVTEVMFSGTSEFSSVVGRERLAHSGWLLNRCLSSLIWAVYHVITGLPFCSLVTARINQFCGHPYSAYIEELVQLSHDLFHVILIVSRLVQVHTQLCACLSGAEVSYVVAYPHKLLLDESGNYLWMSGYVSSCSYLLGFLRSVAGTMDFSSSWADSCR